MFTHAYLMPTDTNMMTVNLCHVRASCRCDVFRTGESDNYAQPYLFWLRVNYLADHLALTFASTRVVPIVVRLQLR
jgi:hypothetical protein